MNVETGCLRFGVYELNLSARELRKHGIRIKLRGQPFEILAILLEKPGEIVTREVMQKRLWPADTFVDFEHSLNSAIKKLRQALGDSPENSRYVETIPRLGYRFIAPVEPPSTAPEAAMVGQGVAIRSLPTAVPPPKPLMPMHRLFFGAIVVVAAGLAILVGVSPAKPRLLRMTQLTHSGRVDPWGRICSDGARIFYLDRKGDHWDVMQVANSGEPAQPFAAPFRSTRVFAVSSNSSDLLIGPFRSTQEIIPLWLQPVVGGAPKRLGEIRAVDATVTPDGRLITYSLPDGIYSAEIDGSNPRRLVSIEGYKISLSWSPDGSRLRFTIVTEASAARSLWEVSADGRNLRPLLRDWPQPHWECCGRWTADGRYYIFVAERAGLQTIWALPESRGLYFWKAPKPVQLTAGPIHFSEPFPAADGKRLFVWGNSERAEFARYLPSKRKLSSLLTGISAFDLSLSPDGNWVAYCHDWKLWRSRIDGNDRQQLTSELFELSHPQWSPDGTQIAVAGRRRGQSNTIFRIAADGGELHELLPPSPARDVPSWSPDGKSIVFAELTTSGTETGGAVGLFRLDLTTGKVSMIRGSEGLRTARWSPNGNYLAASSGDYQRVALFDSRAQRWMELGRGHTFYPPVWSRDSQWVYFQDVIQPGEPVLRYRPKDGKREVVANLRELLDSGVLRASLNDVAQDGSLILDLLRGSGDVYALDVDLP